MASTYALIRVPPVELRQVQHTLSRQYGVGSLRPLTGSGPYTLLARLDVADSREEHRTMDAIQNTHGVSGAMVLSRVPAQPRFSPYIFSYTFSSHVTGRFPGQPENTASAQHLKSLRAPLHSFLMSSAVMPL